MLARRVRVACLGLLLSSPAIAGEHLLALDPGSTEIRFRLGATLHSVEGTARLVGDTIRCGPRRGGAARGDEPLAGLPPARRLVTAQGSARLAALRLDPRLKRT